MHCSSTIAALLVQLILSVQILRRQGCYYQNIMQRQWRTSLNYVKTYNFRKPEKIIHAHGEMKWYNWFSPIFVQPWMKIISIRRMTSSISQLKKHNYNYTSEIQISFYACVLHLETHEFNREILAQGGRNVT